MDSVPSSKGRGGAHLSSHWGPSPFQSRGAQLDSGMARSILNEAYHCATMRITAKTATECKQRKQALFKGIEKDALADALVSVVREFPQCAAQWPQLNVLVEPSGLHVLHVVVQAFLSALIVPRSAVNKAERKGPPGVVPLSADDRMTVLKVMIPLEFPPGLKLWKSASFALNLPQCSKALVSLVLQAMAEGEASFASMSFVLQERTYAVHIASGDILRVAALYGELKASTVERFASRGQPDFMADCKRVMLELEALAAEEHQWRLAAGKLAKNSFPFSGFACRLDYAAFRRNVASLMKRLRGEEENVDLRINFGWARAAVQKSAARYYGQGSWKKENLHDVLWTVCAQRPSMRKFVAELLTNKYNDAEEARQWRNFNVPYYLRSRIKCPFEERIDPLSPNAGYLSFPESVKSIRMVSNAKQLRELEGILDDCALGDYPFVGLDAEWSSYLSCSKASILQLALRTQVFIIDLDVLSMDPVSLSKFFDKLFLSEEIVKIGYHFHEDLAQLRHAVNRCGALYHPNNLICIDGLVNLLREESAQQPEVDLDGVFRPPPDCTASGKQEESSNKKERKDGEEQDDLMNGSDMETAVDGEGERTMEDGQESPMKTVDASGESPGNLNNSETTEDTGESTTKETATDGKLLKLSHRAVIEFLTLESVPPEDIYKRMQKVYKQECPSARSVNLWAEGVRRERCPPRKEKTTMGTAKLTVEKRARKEELRAPIKGLSALCECVLGSPLDKTEQCSVWDRRPLRSLQIRYAALDAHCMLMLYDKCAEWASRLNVDVNKLCSQQTPIRIPLPMLWDN